MVNDLTTTTVASATVVPVNWSMISYMDSGAASYSEDDIDKCRDILTCHAQALEQVKDRTSALELVKSTVIRLNKLNEAAGQELIEVDQREEICGFIIKAGA